MADTPKTDALLLGINEGRVYANDGPVADHAREQERRIAALESELTRYREYWGPNPLGGPAKVFHAMACRISAGEEYYSVLRDFGFWTNEEVSALEEALREARQAGQSFLNLFALAVESHGGKLVITKASQERASRQLTLQRADALNGDVIFTVLASDNREG